MAIVRLANPTLDDFQAAGRICEIRWPFLRSLHTRERFLAFQRMGVELIVAREGERLDGVCFALPCRYQLAGGAVEWVNLFQLATRPEARNVGALMMMRIMGLYPTVVSIGVTPEITPLYVALRWKRYDDIWRGVHPLDMRRMAEDYGDRLSEPWMRVTFRAVAQVYNLGAPVAEKLLGIGVPHRTWSPKEASDPQLRAKGATLASYSPLFQSGSGPVSVDAGGVGRVLTTYQEGWGSLREHARLWRGLRGRGAKLCEVLATSAQAKRRLLALGYLPIPMPMWYVDKAGMAPKLIQAMQRNEVSFFHTDKSV